MQFFFSPYLEFIRKAVENLPGVTEKLCFETPAFYVGGKLFARLKEDGETLAIHTVDRDKWIKTDPETFFITDHYLNSKYMLITLGLVQPSVLEMLLTEAWRIRASKKLLRELDQRQDD
jgi:hypothetical protein